MIKVYKKSLSLTQELETKNDIGFIPTMGNIHAGHLSLVEQALLTHKNVVISIYVNPTQFGDKSDFATYPRTLEADIHKLKQLHKRLHTTASMTLFVPEMDSDIYPHGMKVISAQGDIVSLFEGNLRPGHFDGMVTVVTRLFEIVSPNRAYFGKKDFQQYLIVKAMAKTCFPKLEIIGIDISRELTGLALSSRNSRLDSNQIKEALILRNTLLELRSSIKAKMPLGDIQNEIKAILAKDKRFNYLALVNSESLTPPYSLKEKLILLGNFQLGSVNLLDNLDI